MNKILFIVGPTATGKTNIAVSLAKTFNGELVSADSRQVYVGMDIGTGKDKESLHGVPIWMYDVVRPNKPWNVSMYATQARIHITDILDRGKLPIVVGGSGLYIQSLTHPLTVSVPPDIALRSELATYTKIQLQQRLQKIGKQYWDAMNTSDRENPRRLVRKIEMATHSDSNQPKQTTQKFDTLQIGVTIEYPALYARIDERVEKRVQQGVIEEIQSLLDHGYGWDLPSMSGLGYRQWKGFMDGHVSKEESVKQWKFGEHAYARRQMTWFRKQHDIHWFDPTKFKEGGQIESFVRSWYTQN